MSEDNIVTKRELKIYSVNEYNLQIILYGIGIFRSMFKTVRILHFRDDMPDYVGVADVKCSLFYYNFTTGLPQQNPKAVSNFLMNRTDMELIDKLRKYLVSEGKL